MTDHTVTRNAQSTDIRFTPAGDDIFGNTPYTLSLQLQCSGAVLVELRAKGTFMSKYLEHVVRDHCMDERMYGGTATFSIFSDEITVLQAEAKMLRIRGSWDAKYAPGASFTGGDFRPGNGLGDFS